MSTETQAFPYSRCLDCGAEFADRPAMHAHFDETRPAELGKSSHSIQVVNPTPEERARSRVVSEIDDALYDCMRNLERLIDRGTISKEDVAMTLSSYPDFSDAWDDYARENGL